MRASHMSSNRDDAQQVTEETARFISESDEANQTQITRDFVGHGRQIQVNSEQRDVKAPREDTDSDQAECALTRKSTITVGSWKLDSEYTKFFVLQSRNSTQGSKVN